MNIDLAAMRAMIGTHKDSNLSAMLAALHGMGAAHGLNQPVRLAQFLGQWNEESDGFRYVREIWGPTPAQEGYEGRRDLGNTQPGDGYRFRGGGFSETTGRANFRAFTVWAQAHWAGAPDFEANPDLIAESPWSALTAVWYWETHGCSSYADNGNFVGLTESINGGTNGIAVRYADTCRSGLYLLGRDPADVRGFQEACGFSEADCDGVAGRQTFSAVYASLKGVAPVVFSAAA